VTIANSVHLSAAVQLKRIGRRLATAEGLLFGDAPYRDMRRGVLLLRGIAAHLDMGKVLGLQAMPVAPLAAAGSAGNSSITALAQAAAAVHGNHSPGGGSDLERANLRQQQGGQRLEEESAAASDMLRRSLAAAPLLATAHHWRGTGK
jgi:hypothetical protein